MQQQNIVECPVCFQKCYENKINEHLDQCLKKNENATGEFLNGQLWLPNMNDMNDEKNVLRTSGILEPSLSYSGPPPILLNAAHQQKVIQQQIISSSTPNNMNN